MKKRKTYKKLTPEEEAQIRKKLQETPLEKKDTFALIISMLITLLPRVLLILGIFVFFIWLFFLR
ncbi:MAG TPA: hypothetical protein GXZ48_05375 [Acholeplasmataceae bacterium]|jgi:hypothetical protein|nr:hypothetical protein [Acholeplasmataceae bacterium]